MRFRFKAKSTCSTCGEAISDTWFKVTFKVEEESFTEVFCGVDCSQKYLVNLCVQSPAEIISAGIERKT